ncbi:MAG: proprotein convertase P-domain-containing protein [Planctomycetota bacterium]|nr:proprotein convertase P-domain-containing protein [Planctomycetota bacterium]
MSLNTRMATCFALLVGLVLTGTGHADITLCTTIPTPVPISEDAANPTEETISVTTDEAVVDVDVFVDIAHDYIDDVQVEIVSPNGISVRIHDQGGGTNDFINVIFDDQGAANGSIPFDSGCRMQPSGPGTLADLASTSSIGDWTLRCLDTYPGGATGALNGWCLNTFDQTASTAVLAVTNLLCRDLGGTGNAEVTWTNPMTYDEIQVLIGSVVVDTLAGDATSYTAVGPGIGSTMEICLLPSAAGSVPCAPECCTITTQSVAPVVEACRTPASVVGNTVPETIDVITITDDIQIADLQVQIDVNHPFIGDLVIDVIHAGTTVRLHDENGGAATTIEAIYWDLGSAQGTLPLTCGCPVQPTGPGTLTDFQGVSTVGDWTLFLDDVFTGGGPRIGSLDSWCVRAFELGSVTDFSCDAPSGSASAELTWSNPQTYEGFEIYADGNLETTIPDGTVTSYITLPQTVPSSITYCVVPLITGEVLPANCCTSEFLVDPVSDLLASSTPGTGELEASWTSATVYDEVRVYVDGALEDTLAGNATSWIGGPRPVPGTAVICIESFQNGNVSELICKNVALFESSDIEVCRQPGTPINQATSPISDFILVTSNVLIGDIDVLVDLRHPFVGDLIIDLSSPAGIGVRLHDLLGGAEADINVVYSNGAIANTPPYDCGCPMEACGPGTIQDFVNTPTQGPWTMTIEDIYPGNIATFDRWCLFIDAGCQTLPPQDLTATSDGTNIELQWNNPADYDEIQIMRDGVLVASGVPGTSTSFIDTPPAGAYTYEVVGFDFAQGCSNTSLPATAGVSITDVVWIGETGGNVLSGLALADTLTQLGRSVMTVDTLSPNLIDQTGIPEILWCCLGTYPERYELTAADGILLSEIHTGDTGLDGSQERPTVSIYMESNDVWAYDDPTVFAQFDGVEDQIYGNVDNGDDSLVSLVGLDSNFGLDLTGADAPYNQDSGGNDYTDRLVPCDQNPDLGGNRSGMIWQGSDAFGNYGVGVYYDSDFAPVLCQSWEIGGYASDLFTLVPLYLIALEGGGGPTGPVFTRGDVNGDGGTNVADAVFLLASLFVPGSDPISCFDAADCNDDSGVNVADAVYLLSSLFIPGSPPPPDPSGSECGEDPTDDGLDCQQPGICP